MAKAYEPRVSYQDFVREARAAPPESTLLACAKWSAGQDSLSFPNLETHEVFLRSKPWKIARLAVEAILCPKNRRHKMREIDQAQLIKAINTLTDINVLPSYDSQNGDGAKIASFLMAPLIHEQKYYGNPITDLARSSLLFKELKFDWSEIFGMELEEAIISSYLLRRFMPIMGGVFDNSVFYAKELSTLKPLFKNIDTLANVLAKDIQQHKDQTLAARKAQRSHAMFKGNSYYQEQYSYMPFLLAPLVRVNDMLIAPQTELITSPFFASSLIQAGKEKWQGEKQVFTNPLGHAVQNYSGPLLQSIFPGKVISEFKYKEEKNLKDSIDWFAYTDDLLILIEVKSMRLTLPEQAGGRMDNTISNIKDAAKQINDNIDLINKNHKGFETLNALSKTREVVSILVTVDHMPYANTIPNEIKTKNLVLSLQDLENLAGYKESGQDINFLLKDRFTNIGKRWNLFDDVSSFKSSKILLKEQERLTGLIKQYLPSNIVKD